MTTLKLILEATGEVLATATFDGDKIVSTGPARDLVDSRRRRGFSDEQVWRQLYGWSNGYLIMSPKP